MKIQSPLPRGDIPDHVFSPDENSPNICAICHCRNETHGTDPFQKEKDIRAGKLDADRPSFEELTGWLSRVPSTWLPALLIRVVQLCEHEKVFQDGGLERTVAKVVADSKKPIGLR